MSVVKYLCVLKQISQQNVGTAGSNKQNNGSKTNLTYRTPSLMDRSPKQISLTEHQVSQVTLPHTPNPHTTGIEHTLRNDCNTNGNNHAI